MLLEYTSQMSGIEHLQIYWGRLSKEHTISLLDISNVGTSSNVRDFEILLCGWYLKQKLLYW